MCRYNDFRLGFTKNITALVLEDIASKLFYLVIDDASVIMGAKAWELNTFCLLLLIVQEKTTEILAANCSRKIMGEKAWEY